MAVSIRIKGNNETLFHDFFNLRHIFKAVILIFLYTFQQKLSKISICKTKTISIISQVLLFCLTMYSRSLIF